MNVRRLFRHLLAPQWWVLRAFDRATLDAIEQAVAAVERRHHGELRFVVEGLLPPGHLLRGTTARERAVELFSNLHVWDTANNSGILIYVQMGDRRVEILADRGIASRVAQAEWDGICRTMEQAFAAGDYHAGAVAAIGQAGEILARWVPSTEAHADELPDRPFIV